MKCRSCDRTVSPRAKACPGCGEPDPGKSSWGWFWFFVIGVIILTAAGK